MKTIKGLVAILMVCLTFLAVVKTSFALAPPTHEYLNERIALGNIGSFSLDGYLKQHLTLDQGVTESLDNKSVYKWISFGGTAEDLEPTHYVRSFNHFHDPLVLNWRDAGWEDKQSSIVWAEREIQDFGLFSWPNARDYFFLALTAGNDYQRDHNFARTFRSLGQLMHLVQDASVPAHTRNDGHVLFMYEGWIEQFMNKEKGTFDSILAVPVMPLSQSLTSRVGYNPDATFPIAGLFDTDTYTGTNPGITPFNSVGLAEYTNANFFSEDTIFKNYTYPALSSVSIMEFPVPTQDGGSALRPYFYKSGEGDAGYPLATVGYLKYYAHKYFPSLDETHRAEQGPALDSTCYEAYATRLLPRAVAYSSELLRYFFRGDIEAIDAKEIKDANSEITGMKMKVKNSTPNEGMAGGNLVVSCRYKPDGETSYTYNT